MRNANIRKLPFANDKDFRSQIEMNIEPDRYFPYVQLQKLDNLKMNLQDLSEVQIPKTPSKRKLTERKCRKKSLEPTSKLKVGRNQGKDFQCYICQLEFGNPYMVGVHIKARHKEVAKPFICPNCPLSFETNFELKCHLVSKHPDEFKFYTASSNTNGKFPKKNLFVYRLTMKCPHCPIKFPFQSHLTSHLMSHFKEKPHVCTTCGAKYKSSAMLKYHQAKQKCQGMLELKAKRNFTCTYCNQSVRTQKYLTQHMKVLHGVQPPVREKKSRICLFCGYDAKNAYLLQLHNHIHTGEKPFECSYCGCRMAKKCNLLKHIRSNCKVARAVGTLKECTKTTKSHKIKSRNLPSTVPPPSAHQRETNLIKDDTLLIEDSSSLTTERKQSELTELKENDLIRWEDPLLLAQNQETEPSQTINKPQLDKDKLKSSSKIMLDPLAGPISEAPGGSKYSSKVEQLVKASFEVDKSVRDPVLDWVRNTTNPNTRMDLASFDCSLPDVIPTTVLKMEP